MTVFIISLIRTVIPVIVGAVLTTLAEAGLNIDEAGQQGLTTALFVLFTAIYYFIVRLIEQHVPWFGILLGYAKSPDSYSKSVPSVTVTSTPSSIADTNQGDGPDHRA